METESRNRVAQWALLPLVALAVWGLYSLLGGDRNPAPERRPMPAGERGIRFAWPVPSEVEVTERDIRPAQTVEYKYTVELQESGIAGLLVVRKRDFKVLKVDGLDVEAETFGTVRAPLELEKMSPDIFIDPNGDIKDVEKWDSFNERVEQKMNELVNAQLVSPQHMQNTRERMRDPEIQEEIRNGSVAFWTLWVNGWLEHDFSESEELVVPGVFMLPDGDLDVPQTLRHEGLVEEDPGFVKLSAERRATGERVTEGVKLQYRDAKTQAAITAVEVVASSWVVLRPETMQPIRAQSETRQIITSTLKIPDRVIGEQYVFDWK